MSPRIPFWQIRRLLHVASQYRIRGQLVNIANDGSSMTKLLPGELNDVYAINTNLKRKLVSKVSSFKGMVCMGSVMMWLDFFC